MTKTFSKAVSNKFVGQPAILNQLDLLGEEIRAGKNFNILLSAQSGYGKTRLATLFVKWASKGHGDTQAYAYNSSITKVGKDRRFHILDEAHLIKDPEFLYPLMDSGRYTFIIVTNEYYKLKEPLRNRCHEFIFSNYTRADLIKICKMFFRNARVSVEKWVVESIVDSLGRGVPRTVKVISQRLSLYFKQSGVPKTRQLLEESFRYLLDTRCGLSKIDRDYLTALNNAGGRASLSFLSTAISVPKEVLSEMVEPYLVSKRIVSITGRGRVLNHQNLESYLQKFGGATNQR